MIEVAAAIIEKDGRLLICKRGAGGSCANLWEFPGGKIESGETAAMCAVRECQEELAMKIRIVSEYKRVVYTYPDREVALTFLLAEPVSGEAQKLVHKELRWVTPKELPQYTFCPADEEIIHMLSARD